MISSENKRLSDLEYGKLNRYYNQKLQEWVEDTNMVNGSMQITFYDRIGRLDATKTSEVTDNQLSEKMNMQNIPKSLEQKLLYLKEQLIAFQKML